MIREGVVVLFKSIKKMMTVRNKLLLFILVPLVTTLLALLYQNYNLVIDNVTATVESNGLEQVKNNAKLIDNWLTAKENEVKLLANSVNLEEGWNQKQEELWVIIDKLKANSLQGTFANLMLIDLNGQAWTTQDRGVYDLSKRDYFQQVKESKSMFISDPVNSKLSAKDIFTVTVPLTDQSGKMIGVLAGNVLLSPLQEIVDDFKLGQTGYAYLLNSIGLTIAHPDRQNILKLDLTNSNNSKISTELASISENMISGDFGKASYNYEGIDKYVYYHPIGEANWSLALTVPVKELTVAADEIFKKSAIGYGVLLVIISIIVFLLSGSIAKAIQEVQQVLAKVAKGDFTEKSKVRSYDELGKMAKSLNITIDQLSEVLHKVQRSSINVSNASEEISGGNQDLSQRTQEQASSLEEVSATIQQITASIQEVAASSDNTDNLATKTMEVIEEGSQVVGRTMESMSKITASSKEIAAIINVVNDIAFQTNLLALNAAVEAARAGEHGKGFAVVAAEVRNLSARTAESAKEIENLISNIISQIEEGNHLVEETGNSLQQIVENSKHTSEAIAEIAVAMEEQSSAAGQIQGAVEELNQVTQQNASMVEEISSSSDSLNDEANELANIISGFKFSNVSTRKQVSTKIGQEDYRDDEIFNLLKDNKKFNEDDFERF
jgi:methyl-accepting chemotaxis protein